MPEPEVTERLKQVLSKIAPLERWKYAWVRGRPEICWNFYRPAPERYSALIKIIDSFEGRMKWVFMAEDGDCLVPVFGRAVFLAPPAATMAPNVSSVPVEPEPKINGKDVAADLKRLAGTIEEQLELKDVKPVVFSPEMLTREGLRKSRGPFDDFMEGGQLTVFLVVNPGSTEHYQETEQDIFLHFAPFDDELTAILNEILQTDLTEDHGRAMMDEEIERARTKYPTFWEISDYYQGGYLNPAQAKLLLEECTGLSDQAKSPTALRGLDKLIRIANWASTKGYGVFFSAP